MARAKRTDRAEARRRHRVVTQTSVEERVEAPPAESGSRPLAKVRRRQADPFGQEPVATDRRPGLFGAMRAAYRPIEFREDFRLLPAITTRTKAIWLPALLILIAGVLWVIRAVANQWVELYATLFLAISGPVMLPPFIAGFLSPRAGWLTGLIVAALSGIVTIGAVAAVPDALPLTRGASISVQQFAPVVVTLMPFGALVGAFSAWYRRFLSMTSPARTRPGSKASSRSRPAVRRR